MIAGLGPYHPGMTRTSQRARAAAGLAFVALATASACASTAAGGGDDDADEGAVRADARPGGGGMDAAPGTGAADGAPGVSDAAPAMPDAAPAMPDAAPAGGGFELALYEISDSASSGTPDTYVFEVAPGGPVHAELTGTGSGAWTLAMSNGTSLGIWCIDVPVCDFVMPAGQTTLVVTARTEDIGFYTLRLSIPIAQL